MHWAVTVERDGEKIVTIESNCLSGREISAEDSEAIRNAAWHLLSFLGDPAPCDLVTVPRLPTDRMLEAYGIAVYYTSDTKQIPENVWLAMCAAAPTDCSRVTDAAMVSIDERRENLKRAFVAGCCAVLSWTNAGMPQDDLDEAGYDYAASVLANGDDDGGRIKPLGTDDAENGCLP